MAEQEPTMEAWMDEQGFDEQEKVLFRKYYPIAWNKPTAHSEIPGTIITTIPHLFRHARTEEQLLASEVRLDDARTRTQAREQRISYKEASINSASAWKQWHIECQARKSRIAEAKKKWHDRITEGANKKREIDAWVAEARNQLYTAQAEPVPTKPA